MGQKTHFVHAHAAIHSNDNPANQTTCYTSFHVEISVLIVDIADPHLPTDPVFCSLRHLSSWKMVFAT